MSLLVEGNKVVSPPILSTPLPGISPPSRSNSGVSSYYTASSNQSPNSYLTLDSMSPRWPSLGPTQDLALKLNFRYQCLYRLESNDDISSDSSVSDNDDLSLCHDVNLENLCSRRQTSFVKYIPLKDKYVHKVPKIEQNKRDPAEWKECQNAYLNLRAQSNLFVRNSKSDTAVLTASKPDGTQKKKNKLKRFLRKWNRRELNSVKREVSSLNNFDPGINNVAFPRRSDPRFSDSINVPYIKLNIKERPEFSAELYAQIPTNNNHGLCHVTTELVVSAMLNFFHPYSDVQCLWLSDLQNKIVDEIRKPNMRAKFTKLVYLGRFEALLVLSKDAGALLRHRDICFLHSLAAALRIGFHRLLVLVNENPGSKLNLV